MALLALLIQPGGSKNPAHPGDLMSVTRVYQIIIIIIIIISIEDFNLLYYF